MIFNTNTSQLNLVPTATMQIKKSKWHHPMWFACFLLISVCVISKAMANSFSEEALINVQSMTFDSKLLKRKQGVSIYLPKSYQHSSKSYPVVYVLDSDFLLNTAIDVTTTRASRDLMPESIIVGLSTKSSASRLSIAMPMKREKGSDQISFANAKPELFLAFLQQELMPLVNAEFRTANYATLIGMSPTVGVLLTDYFNDKSIFNAYIALAADPQLFTVKDEYIADKIANVAQSKTTPFHISRGEFDLANNPTTRTAFEHLETSLKSKNIDSVKSEIIQGGEHYATSIEGINRGFRHIFPETVWQPDYLTLRKSDNPTAALQSFYKNLSKTYGFKTYPIADGYWMGFSLGGTTRYLIRNKRSDEAVELLTWALKAQSNNITLQNNLTWALEESGQLPKAVSAAKKLVTMADKQKHTSIGYFKEYLAELEQLSNKTNSL